MDHEGRLFELIDGILVEKTVGIFESLVAGLVLAEIWAYLRTHDLGQAFPTDAAMRILPGMVRIPDVCFLSWERIPRGIARRPAIPPLSPDLAVEVLSRSNTRREMDAKLEDYFRSGTRLVWYIDPAHRSADVFTGPDQVTRLDEDGVLDGGQVLPDFRLSFHDLFARAERQAPEEGATPGVD
jgi:Uma2 family endonuclease